MQSSTSVVAKATKEKWVSFKVFCPSVEVTLAVCDRDESVSPPPGVAGGFEPGPERTPFTAFPTPPQLSAP